MLSLFTVLLRFSESLERDRTICLFLDDEHVWLDLLLLI